MNWNKPVKFKLGDVDWEMPLSTLVLVLAVTLVLMLAGGWMGYRFGAGKFCQRSTVHGRQQIVKNLKPSSY
jgi:hypothetical protein